MWVFQLVRGFTQCIYTTLILSAHTNTCPFYLETGYEPLGKRRDRTNFVTMHKIYNNLFAVYMKNIAPTIKNATSTYNIRNSLDYQCLIFLKTIMLQAVRKLMEFDK